MSLRGGIALLSGLAVTAPAFGTNPDGFTEAGLIAWTCPQTGTSTVPNDDFLQVDFSIRADATPSVSYNRLGDTPVSNARTAIANFRQLMRNATANHPRLDVFSCGQQFASRLLDELFYTSGAPYRLTKSTPAPERARIERARIELEDHLMDVLRDYGSEAYANRALTAFEPAATSNPPIHESLGEVMTMSMRANCNLAVESFSTPARTQLNTGVLRQPSSNLYLDRSILERLPEMTDGLTEECKNKVSGQYAQLLLDSMPEGGTCTSGDTACTQRLTAVQLATAYLSRAGLGPRVADDVKREIEACHVAAGPLAGHLERLIDDVNGTSQCSYPAVGEEVYVAGGRRTSAGSNYYLSRLPDEGGKPVLRATVNLNFIDPDGNTASEMSNGMFQRVRNCLATASTKMTGPDGSRLELAVVRDSTRKNSVRDVHLSSSVSRDNAGSWNTSSPCSTIVHETMHILGLCDEYPEQSGTSRYDYTDRTPGHEYVRTSLSADKPMFNCRRTSVESSIMYNHCAAFRAVGLTDTGAGCPPFATPTARSSLLFPAQYRALTQPFCTSTNNTFYRCSREAMRTSREHYGVGRCSPGLPTECSGTSTNWLTR